MNRCDIKPKCTKLDGITIVVIPAPLGDSSAESLYAPKIGDYKNAIVKYLADNKVYAYDKGGNWALISDLSNSIQMDDFLDINSKHAVTNHAITEAIDNLTAALSDETDARKALDDSLAPVAKSGKYTDLTDTPDIPVVNDGTLTVKKNGTEVATFSANSSSNVEANISVPTKTSELNNDSNFVTDASYVHTDNNFSNTLKDKLDGIESGAEVNVQSDWDEADSNSDAYIKNKPTIPTVDTTYNVSSNNAIANSTVTNSLDRGVVTDIAIDSTASTTTVKINETKTNLANPASTVSTAVTLPVASTTQAGVMNSATYDAVTANTTNINALINGAVAVTGLSASPSQSDITTAWQTATGLTALMNRASVYDVSNSKVWTYYTNDTTWHAASNTTQVTVNQFTNSSAGTIKGSTSTGQVFAENDGTGSVNGWDTLTSTVGDHTSKLATIAQGAEVNVQSNWTENDNTSDAYILNKPSLATVATSGSYNDLSDLPTIPTVNDATLTIQKNGTTVNTFTANASSNVTANIAVPTNTSDLNNDSGFLTTSSSIFDDVAYIYGDATVTTGPAIGTSNIADDAITAEKIADGAAPTITMTTTDPGEGVDLASNHFIGVYV